MSCQASWTAHARCLTPIAGPIARISDPGEIQDILASGKTQVERHQVWGWHEGFGLFDYLDRIQELLRLKDFHGRMRALGLSKFQPPMPVNSPLLFLTAPSLSCDKVVGSFFLGEKGRKKGFFAADDGETLIIFDSQAGLVIANAKRDQDRKARGSPENSYRHFDYRRCCTECFDLRGSVIQRGSGENL